jgi:hypothetical protein
MVSESTGGTIVPTDRLRNARADIITINDAMGLGTFLFVWRYNTMGRRALMSIKEIKRANTRSLLAHVRYSPSGIRNNLRIVFVEMCIESVTRSLYQTDCLTG